MLQLRRLDAPGRRAYLDELRPRMVLLRVRARGVRLMWAVPLWPFEQLLALVLGVALLAPGLLRFVPAELRSRMGVGAAGETGSKLAGQAAAVLGYDRPGTLLERLSLLAAGGLGDALRLPPGEPYVSVRTADAFVEITTF